MASFTFPWVSAAGDTVAAFYDNAFGTKTAAPSVCLDQAIEVPPLGHQRWRPNLAHRLSAEVLLFDQLDAGAEPLALPPWV